MSSNQANEHTIPALSSPGDEQPTQISRRTLLAGSGAIGAMFASGLAIAGDSAGHNHADHAPQHANVLDAATHCSDMSQLCLAHCLVSFQEGDTTLATCARKVSETASLCDALAAQVRANSPYVEGMAAVCRQACEDCEKECRKHEDDHRECRDCADSCAKLIKAIDAMA